MDNKKDGKQSINVSLKPSVMACLEKAENKSSFVENSVEGMKGICSVLEKLKQGTWDLDRAMEEIEDLAGVWESSFDETI